jgi:biotin operon repressor
MDVIPYERLLGLIQRKPTLAIELWRQTALEAAIAREWLTNLGRRSAYGRLSHLFCEMWYRLRMAGLTEDHSYDFPVTQGELADALGLSVVHVNRTLQQLRAEGLIAAHSPRIRLLDLSRLQAAAEFDPSYLNVRHTQSEGQQTAVPNDLASRRLADIGDVCGAAYLRRARNRRLRTAERVA